jgi:hypothetical protein
MTWAMIKDKKKMGSMMEMADKEILVKEKEDIALQEKEEQEKNEAPSPIPSKDLLNEDEPPE